MRLSKKVIVNQKRDKPIRIAFMSNGPTLYTGYSAVLRNIVSRIALDSRFECIIYDENAGWGAQYDWNGIPVFGIPVKQQPGSHPNLLDGFLEVVKKTQPDIVWFLEDSFTLNNFGFTNIIKLPAKRVFYIALDGRHVPTTGVNLCRTMDKLVAMAQFGKDILDEEGFDNVEKILHGVDLDTFKPVSPKQKEAIRKKYGFKPDDFIIFNYGRNTNLRKNNQGMLNILCEYLKDAPKNHYAYLHIMNRDNTENNLIDYLERFLIPKYGIDVVSRIIWSPVNDPRFAPTHQDIAQMIQMSDLSISASIGEGFGLLMSESPACGVPVIHCEYSTPYELLIEERGGIGPRGWTVPIAAKTTSGLNVEHGYVDEQEFVRILKEVINNPEERKRRGENGRAFTEKYLNWSYLVEEWKDLFLRLV